MKMGKHNDTPALNASQHWAASQKVGREKPCGGLLTSGTVKYCPCVGKWCQIGAFCVEKDGGKFLISDYSSVEGFAAIIL